MTPRKVNILLVFMMGAFVALMMGVLQAGSRSGGIVWATNLTQATVLARQSGKPLLVSFHLMNCPNCARMEAETFANPNVIALAQQYICVRVDGDTDPQSANAAHVDEYPATVLLTPDGREKFRWAGYIPPDRFAALLKEELSTK